MKNGLLKVAVGLCLLFCAVRLGEFIYNRIPPFKVGECHIAKTMPLVIIKIRENHLVEGYSDVEVSFFNMKSQVTATFAELRQDTGEQVECF